MTNTPDTALHEQNLYRITCTYRNGKREETLSVNIFGTSANSLMRLAQEKDSTLIRYMKRRALNPRAKLKVRSVELIREGRSN